MGYNTMTGVDTIVAAEYLQKGEVVAIPTETVYGLAGNALNPDAVLKIFETKNRPFFDPLIVHVAGIDAIEQYTVSVPDELRALMHAFMPGPLTVLLKKKDIIPDVVTSGLDSVAIRVPQHPLTLELLKALDFPLAAPSANPFGYISPTTAQHVYDQLQGRIPYILDGGPTSVGVESTIIGYENEALVVYRLGGLAIEEIEKVAGKIVLGVNESTDLRVPGMLKSHYAPKKKLVFNDKSVLKTESNAAVIGFDAFIDGIDIQNQVLLSAKGDLNEAAKNLFSVMRRLDNSSADFIYAVKFPETGLGRAINDRLKRAAAN